MTHNIPELTRFKSSLDRFRDVAAAISVVGFVVAATCFAEIALYLKGVA